MVTIACGSNNCCGKFCRCQCWLKILPSMNQISSIDIKVTRAVFYGCDLQTRDIPIIPFICLFCTPMHITPVTCTPQYKIWTKIDCTSSENAFPIPLFFHLYNNICKLTQGCTNQPYGCIHVSQFLLGLNLGPGRMFEEISRSLLVGIVSTWATSMSI